MRKRLIVLPLVFILALAACHPAAVPGESMPPATQPSTQPTTQPYSQPPTKPTTQPTSQPTQPTTPPKTYPSGEALQQFIDQWNAYCMQPETFRVIPGYDPTACYDYPGKNFDGSQLIEGWFYILDDGDVYLLSEEKLVILDITFEHIYYQLITDDRTVYRCDHRGENITLLYKSEYGEINQAHYNGTDSNGQLLLCEFGEEQRIIALDIPTGNIHTLLTSARRTRFFYYPHSLSYTEENKGPVLELFYTDEDGLYQHKIYLIDSAKYLPEKEPDNPPDKEKSK